MDFYFLQLFLNFLFSSLLIGLKSVFLAFIDGILLDIAVIINIYLFFMKSSLAGWLLIPYLVWISFASYLNSMLWKLKRNTNEKVINEKEN